MHKQRDLKFKKEKKNGYKRVEDEMRYWSGSQTVTQHLYFVQFVVFGLNNRNGEMSSSDETCGRRVCLNSL